MIMEHQDTLSKDNNSSAKLMELPPRLAFTNVITDINFQERALNVPEKIKKSYESKKIAVQKVIKSEEQREIFDQKVILDRLSIIREAHKNLSLMHEEYIDRQLKVHNAYISFLNKMLQVVSHDTRDAWMDEVVKDEVIKKEKSPTKITCY
mmetsp:Transcript_1616/g.1107  ORF Transcript_1616/g.1107 Transcript_1616/m.1107 type:complete len:151 (+) Transcript_1616:274-726(+)